MFPKLTKCQLQKVLIFTNFCPKNTHFCTFRLLFVPLRGHFSFFLCALCLSRQSLCDGGWNLWLILFVPEPVRRSFSEGGCLRGNKSAQSVKSAIENQSNARVVKSKNQIFWKFFLLLFSHRVTRIGYRESRTFFSANAQVRPIIEGVPLPDWGAWHGLRAGRPSPIQLFWIWVI